jgi:hypothetical protein
MSISDVTSKGVFRSYGAIVGSLFTGRHTSLRPSKRGAFIKIEKSEFLFQSEPDFFIFFSLKGFGGCVRSS